jgi:hypothetical protein
VRRGVNPPSGPCSVAGSFIGAKRQIETSVFMADALPRCPKCQSSIHADWPYCSHCGSRLWTGPIPPPPIPICGHCGAQVDPMGSFCWWCGVPVHTGREPILPVKSGIQASTPPQAASVAIAGTPARGASAKYPPSVSKARPTSRRPVLGGALLLVAIVLLLVSLFVGWYSVSATAIDNPSGTSYTVSASATLYPLNYVAESFSCTGSSSCFASSTYNGSYAQGGFSSVGALYGVVAGLIVGGAALGCAAVALAFAGGYRKSVWAGRLAVLALIVIVIAPTLLLVAQPAVLNAQGTPPGGASPRSSFAGSCTGSGCGTDIAPGATSSASWGPSIGWYLGWVAVIPLLLGWFELRAHKKRSAAASVYQLAR